MKDNFSDKDAATPSTAVQMSGLNSVPIAGDDFVVAKSLEEVGLDCCQCSIGCCYNWQDSTALSTIGVHSALCLVSGTIFRMALPCHLHILVLPCVIMARHSSAQIGSFLSR